MINPLEHDISKCRSLEEISEYRRQQLLVENNSGNDYSSILTEIYQKPSHFVYELLQNADDAGASKVEFRLEKDRLLFFHNGKRDFTLKDIIAITGVGNSTKKNDKETVGKYGVGFKSVFAISRRPEIYSRTFNFAIENLQVPVPISKRDLEGYTTLFIIPFASEKYQNDEIYAKIEKEYATISVATIMFLRHIKKVKFGEREISLKKTTLDGYKEVRDDERSFVVFSDEGKFGSCSLAFEKDADGAVVRTEIKEISSFLPTKVSSGVSFVVDAPFRLSTTREQIDFDDADNRVVVQSLRKLFRRAILGLKSLGLLSAQTLAILPIDEQGKDLQAEFHEELCEMARVEPILPTKFGHVSARVGKISSDLTIQKLFGGNGWVDTGARGLKDFYSNELGIRVYGLDDLIGEVTEKKLLCKKNEKWLYRFYEECLKYIEEKQYYKKQACGFLAESEIWKTRTGQFRKAYVGESQKLFLPSKGITSARIVHEMFTTQSKNVPEETRERMRRLLAEIGIKSRSPKSTIEMDYMSRWKKAEQAEKLEIFREVAGIYNKATADEREEIVYFLQDEDVMLIETEEGEGRVKKWIVPSEYYFYEKTPEMKLLLGGVNGTYFVADEIWTEEYQKKTSSDGAVKQLAVGTSELCRELGARKHLCLPKRTWRERLYLDSETRDLLRQMEKMTMLGKSVGGYVMNQCWVNYSYELSEMKEIIEGISTPTAGKILVEEILGFGRDKWTDNLHWTGGNCSASKCHDEIPASYLLLLSRMPWVVDNEGNKHKTDELTKQELIEMLGLKETVELDELLKMMVLKQEWEDQLDSQDKQELQEFRDAKRLADEYGVSLNEVMRSLSEKKQEKVRQDGAEDVRAEEIDLGSLEREIEVDDGKNIGDDASMSVTERAAKDYDTVRGSGRLEVPEAVRGNADGTKKAAKKHISTTERGKYGEAYVMKYLQEKYGVRERLENNGAILMDGRELRYFGGSHEGYDIGILRDDEIEERIEVKYQNGREIEITSAEWECMKLSGEQYSIYWLSDKVEGRLRLRILKDPYSMVQRGKIKIVPSKLIVGG